MQFKKLFIWLFIGSLVSIGLGLGARFFPILITYGWVFGPLIAIMFGFFAGQTASSRISGAGSGALVGGFIILIGTSIGFLAGTVSATGILRATTAGIFLGFVSGFISQMISQKK